MNTVAEGLKRHKRHFNDVYLLCSCQPLVDYQWHKICSKYSWFKIIKYIYSYIYIYIYINFSRISCRKWPQLHISRRIWFILNSQWYYCSTNELNTDCLKYSSNKKKKCRVWCMHFFCLLSLLLPPSPFFSFKWWDTDCQSKLNEDKRTLQKCTVKKNLLGNF